MRTIQLHHFRVELHTTHSSQYTQQWASKIDFCDQNKLRNCENDFSECFTLGPNIMIIWNRKKTRVWMVLQVERWKKKRRVKAAPATIMYVLRLVNICERKIKRKKRKAKGVLKVPHTNRSPGGVLFIPTSQSELGSYSPGTELWGWEGLRKRHVGGGASSTGCSHTAERARGCSAVQPRAANYTR